MNFEQELAAGVFVTSYCGLCGVEAPATQTIRDCCQEGAREDRLRYLAKHPSGDKVF